MTLCGMSGPALTQRHTPARHVTWYSQARTTELITKSCVCGLLCFLSVRVWCFCCVCMLCVCVCSLRPPRFVCRNNKTNKKVPKSETKKNVKDTPRPLASITLRRALYKGEPLTSTCLYSLAWWRQMPARHVGILEVGPVVTSCETLVRPNPSRHRARLKAIEVRGSGGYI